MHFFMSQTMFTDQTIEESVKEQRSCCKSLIKREYLAVGQALSLFVVFVVVALGHTALDAIGW